MLLALVALFTQATLSLSAPPEGGQEPGVVIAFPDQRSHREVAAAIEQSLRDAACYCQLISLPADDDPAEQERAVRELLEARPMVVAAGGTKATQLALHRLPETPVVFFLVPNALDAPFMEPGRPERRRVAGVTTDIAPGAQIEWLTALAPGAHAVGVLKSRRSERTALRIQAAGGELGLAVTLIEADKDEFMSAIDALYAANCDAVVMIPDAQVYNSVSVERLLLWGIVQKKPVSTFSAHVVKAGALTGQYGDNQAIGRQVADLVHRVLRGADVASIGLHYPDRIHTAVNERTAEMIDITIDRKRLASDTERFGSE